MYNGVNTGGAISIHPRWQPGVANKKVPVNKWGGVDCRLGMQIFSN